MSPERCPYSKGGRRCTRLTGHTEPHRYEISTPRPPNPGDNAVCETATNTAATDDIWEQMRNNIRNTTVV